MAKLTLNDIAAGYAAPSLVNANNDLIETALENTLSRDGTSPNTMEASLDMNSHEIINLASPTGPNSAARFIDVTDAISVTNLTAPSQSGNANKALKTDGSAVSWAYPGSSLLPVHYDQSLAEIAAGITPTNYAHAPGNLLRYGTNSTPGTTDMSAALQAAVNQCNQIGGAPVTLPSGTILLASGVTGGTMTKIRGAGRSLSYVTYSGNATAIGTNASGTRTYDWELSGFTLINIGAGLVGLDLRSVSTSNVEDMLVDGFTNSGILLTGSNGYCVYDTFVDVTTQNCGDGFTIGAAGSNSNRFIACRANICTIGVNITDSNQNNFFDCQFEVCGRGIKITASSNALSDRNTIMGCRFEGCTTYNYDITSTFVRETWASGNHHVTGTYQDLGVRTQLDDVFGTTGPRFQRISAQTASALGAFYFERSASGGTSLPAMRVVDSASASGTPITVQIETERTPGKFFSGKRGGVEYSYLDSDGKLMLTGAAPVVAAGQIGIGATTAGTVGAAGGASALPATPTGYLIVNIAGTNFKIPYYAN